MEKSNSRARRNGNGPQAGTSTGTSTSETAGGPPEALVSGRVGAGKVRQEVAPGAALLDHADGPRSLQDTFIDERNDVLAVINELEDQLDRHQEIRETMERELTATSEKLQASNQRVQELEWQVVTLQTRADALEQARGDVTSLEEELADANARAQRDHEQVVAVEKERTPSLRVHRNGKSNPLFLCANNLMKNHRLHSGNRSPVAGHHKPFVSQYPDISFNDLLINIIFVFYRIIIIQMQLNRNSPSLMIKDFTV